MGRRQGVGGPVPELRQNHAVRQLAARPARQHTMGHSITILQSQ